MRKKQIYLTWDAYSAGFIATANALEKLFYQENIVIDKVYYLHNKPLTSKNYDGWQAFVGKGNIKKYTSRYKSEGRWLDDIQRCWSLGKSYPNNKIGIETKHLDIKAVTDYQSIYDQVLSFLRSDIDGLADFDLHINVSPGTPQMHVVWLMLNSAGYLPRQAKLWASQIIKEENKKDKTILNVINFKPKTFLSEVLASRSNKVNLISINPNDTKSKKRKEVEELLRLYSVIPKAQILILGERGTGKSTYVKTLIRESYGKEDFPIEEIACGTLSEDLMRSELFGHAKGAFTGATVEKKGLLSKFKKEGILFLDEIHDLSKALQRQLIQVLQSGEYYPVGSEEKRKTNPRIIVASNYSYKKLRDEILDADFFDRVARFVLEVPPLRECKEDLEGYWRKTWEEMSNFDAAPKVIWNQQIKNYLYKAELRGNFRDLQKLISYLMVFYLKEKNVQKAFKLARDQYEKWQSKPNDNDNDLITRNCTPYLINGATYKYIVSKFNHDLVIWAKEQYGNIENAAKILDRATSTLYEDLRKGKD